MSMHLHHPALSLNGKRRGKVKWASAEQKRRHQELEIEWQNKMRELTKLSPAANNTIKKVFTSNNLSPRVPPGRETKFIPSLDTGHKGAVSSKPAQMYTGTKIIGIGTLHKSNAVPVFSNDEAKDMARMRRG